MLVCSFPGTYTSMAAWFTSSRCPRGNDGWPRIGEQIGNCGVGQPVLRWPRPKGLTPSPALAPQTSDYFAQGQPGIQWQWQANPSPEWLLPAKGELRLRCVPLSEVDGQRALYWAPQLLLQKFPALTFSAKTSVTLYAAQDGDAGGLIVYGERYAALLVEFGQGGYRLVWRHGWMSDAGVVRETRQVLAELKCGKCQLQVAVGEGGLCQFSGEPRRSGGRFLFVLLPGRENGSARNLACWLLQWLAYKARATPLCRTLRSYFKETVSGRL